MLGPEFGADAGKEAFLVHAFYGLKSAAGSFSHHLADCMRTLGHSSCKADSDLRYKPVTCLDDGVWILCLHFTLHQRLLGNPL